jgi:hypothetical protein
MFIYLFDFLMAVGAPYLGLARAQFHLSQAHTIMILIGSTNTCKQ